MGKKKAAETQPIEAATLDTALSASDTDLVKKYGEQAFINGADFLEEPKQLISVSPKLDMILGGGVPEGSFVIFAGPPKVGKTVTALQLARNAQRLGRKIYFINVEGRLKPRDLQGIKGLDPSKVEIVRSFKDKDTGQARIFLAHEFLDIAETKINNEPECVVIIDSASMLLTQLEKQGTLGQQHRAPGAVLLSQFCKRISNVIPVNNCIVIMIVHIVANTGGGMKKTSRTGGNKIQYAVDIDLEATHQERWKIGGNAEDEDSGVQIGQKVHWRTGSTGVAPPGRKTVSFLRYGTGIDEVYEIYELAKLLQLVTGTGWHVLEFLRGEPGYEERVEKKINGAEQLMTWLSENPEAYAILERKVKELIG